MIRSAKIFFPQCDCCGEELHELNSASKDTAFDAALEAGWHSIGGKLFCPNCSVYDYDRDEWRQAGVDDACLTIGKTNKYY